MTNSLPCSEPLLRLTSLAIAHGWGWCQVGGSQSGVSNRPVRPSCTLAESARWGASQATPVRPACAGAESACQGTQQSKSAGQASAKG